ncbi:MAG: DMT family transporter [Thermoplasmata archaeon]|nr:MAG: DMT family transporter [Thermoplasmata archaeon]KAA0017323.1 MAG: DMT family transporter [Thermoplasmata archaeon]
MEKQKVAYIYALLAVFFWSTVATAFKISLKYVDFLQLLFISSLTSTIVLFLILVSTGKVRLLRTLDFQQILRSLLAGFLNPFLYYVVLFKAYSLLPAQEAQPLNYTWPLVLVLFSVILLKQRIRVKDIFGLLIGFSGVIVISTRGNLLSLKLSDPLGVSLAVGSAFIWSAFWIFNMKDERDDILKLFLNFLFGFFFVSIAMMFFSRPYLDVHGVLSAIYVGMFEMGITFVVWLKALNLSKTTALVSNLVFLSPFISLIFIHFILGEGILPSTIIGLFLIVTGILVQRS